ncbi:hypothetical protein RHGRI_027392 [Rhododendron griersonianum]|uniref:non-specific serine/threonine protein kinase n=1 Tax=Rhododendron griersonianum TaxID=479676 RepID=A0AAV6IX58_9ERIC|nr:hypothetical protein RHGRI_027392 [Rhododendron griersonianum]
MNCCIAILLLLLLKFATSSSSNNIPDDFTFNGCLKLDGRAELGSNGFFTLNESAEGTIGHAFYSFPIQFKKSLNASVISFSTTFIFAIVSAQRLLCGSKMVLSIRNLSLISGDPMQVLDDCPGNLDFWYRHISKGAWPFSTADHGWPISDCTAEGLKAVLLLSKLPPDIVGEPIDAKLLYDAVNVILSLQVIIHRDIKAGNVLIDDEFNGRLGDFGLAKLCDHGTDPQTSHVAGTLGYIAPELARNGKASTSTDLFAFGAFMLEVVCGRRPVDPRASPEEVILVDWVFECLERGNILEAIDRQLGTEYAVEEAELVLKLGLLCLHAIAAARPSISNVVQYLEGRAQLPNNLGDIIKSRDFREASNEQDVQLPTSVTSLTISEPFTSTGR